MWTHKIRAALAGAAVALLFPAGAFATCIGTNLIPDLRADDPAAVDAMYARAAQVPNGEGRFWKVERTGLPPSYLLGSFHAAEAIDTIDDRIWETFSDAAHVVVEVDLDQQAAMEARMATDVEFSFDLEGPGLSARLDPAQEQAVSDALAVRGMALSDVDKMRPWLLASLLSFPACHLQAMATGAQPMDTAMAQAALERGTSLSGLESYEAAVSAFRRVGPDVLLESIATTGDLADREEDLFRTNLELYADGQIAVIAELGILLGERTTPGIDHRKLSEDVLAEILDARNVAWMPGLTQILSGGDAFVIVGALHLPGDAGLVSLLRREGFTVTRLDK
ncbi:MAG: TraB/GumN family protein [Pseudomonadota bacterium]